MCRSARMALNRARSKGRPFSTNMNGDDDIVKEGPEQARDGTCVKMTRAVPCLRKELGSKSVKR